MARQRKEVMITTLVTKEFHRRLMKVAETDDIPASQIVRLATLKEIEIRERVGEV